MRGIGHGALVLVNEKSLPAATHFIEAGELSADGTADIFDCDALVPAPALIVPGFLTDPQSALSVGSTIPPGVPPGLSLFLQAWIADAVGPKGLSASNGLRALLP
jgi:hypothetical protein